MMRLNEEKQYVCDNEYEDAVVGPMSYIEEMMENKGWVAVDCVFYELGKEVKVKLTVKED